MNEQDYEDYTSDWEDCPGCGLRTSPWEFDENGLCMDCSEEDEA